MNTDVKKIKSDERSGEEYVIVPSADIYETENEFVIKADMPGVNKEGLEITLEKDNLEISGRVRESANQDSLKYAEYRLHNYRRSFVVGDGINREGISASLENGVLALTLPKSERVKPRKIEIKVEA